MQNKTHLGVLFFFLLFFFIRSTSCCYCWNYITKCARDEKSYLGFYSFLLKYCMSACNIYYITQQSSHIENNGNLKPESGFRTRLESQHSDAILLYCSPMHCRLIWPTSRKIALILRWNVKGDTLLFCLNSLSNITYAVETWQRGECLKCIVSSVRIRRREENTHVS